MMHLLPTMMSAQAKLTPENKVWDMGIIQESKGKVFHVYTCTNTGNQPLVINAVHSYCGCAIAEYPHHPIKPGEKVKINVSFDPNGRSNHVNKNFRVIYNAGKSVCNLFLKGFIEAELDPIEDFQYELTNEVRVERLFLYGGTFSKGMKKEIQVSIYNTSSKTKKISHRLLANSRAIKVSSPSLIKPKAAVKITITFDANQCTQAEISDSLLFFFDGKESPKTIKLLAKANLK